MLKLYYWPTPNGHKITIFLEEAGLPYQIVPVDIGKGDQFKPSFLKIAPNNRMPAVVDYDVDGAPVALFESGVILHYLAEKTGKFLPRDEREKWQVLQWLTWQMANLGPMMGQANHFTIYAPQVDDTRDHSYGRERYQNETRRLFGVMDKELASKPYLAGGYSIADMASWPWVKCYDNYGFDLGDWPNLKRWFDDIGARPAVKKAYAVAEEVRAKARPLSEEAKQNLFGKRA